MLVASLTLLLASAPVSDRQAIESELRKFWEEHNRAFQSRDTKALDRLLDDEFHWVHAFGYVDDKATVLKEALEDPSPPGRFPFDVSPPRRLIIDRDMAILLAPNIRTATGSPAYSTVVFIRRAGGWKLLLRQATELNPPPNAIAIEPSVLRAYVGQWKAGGQTIGIELRPDGLYVIGRRFPPRRLYPIGRDLFTTKLGGDVRFTRDAEDRPMSVSFSQRNGAASVYRRAD